MLRRTACGEGRRIHHVEGAREGVEQDGVGSARHRLGVGPRQDRHDRRVVAVGLDETFGGRSRGVVVVLPGPVGPAHLVQPRPLRVESDQRRARGRPELAHEDGGSARLERGAHRQAGDVLLGCHGLLGLQAPQQVGGVAGKRAAVAAVDVEIEDQPLEGHRAQLGRNVPSGDPVDVRLHEDQVVVIDRLDRRDDAVVRHVGRAARAESPRWPESRCGPSPCRSTPTGP